MYGVPGAMTYRASRRRSRLRRTSEILFHPFCWPRWVRRVCILAPPVVLLGWVVLAALVFVGTVLVLLGEAIGVFWNAPQRQRYEVSPFAYSLYAGKGVIGIEIVPTGTDTMNDGSLLIDAAK